VSWRETLSAAWGYYAANRDNLIPLGGFLGGAVIAWAALKQARIATRRHHAQTEADQQRRITESFGKAIEQLASERLEARLGGVYTLERISHESKELYWPVMEILTAFVREHARWEEPDEATSAKLRSSYQHGGNSLPLRLPEHKLTTDVAAVLSVIIRRKAKDRAREKSQRWRLNFSGTDLRQVRLKGVHLEGADFTEAHLEEAWLEGAYLSGANFTQARLDGAYLWHAHLQKADFRGAHLEAAQFREAHLEDAGFMDAHLERAYFERAHLDGANFWRARDTGAALCLNLQLNHKTGGGNRLDRLHFRTAITRLRDHFPNRES
jgi:hypothetical protein